MSESDRCLCGCGQERQKDVTLLAMDGRMFQSLFASKPCEHRWAKGLQLCGNCGHDFAPWLGGRLAGSELVCGRCYDTAMRQGVA